MAAPDPRAHGLGSAPQLNWLARYVPILGHVDDAGRRSLLEVGPGPRGIGTVLTTPFVGVEVSFSQPPHPPMRAIEYGGARLPFKTASFHTVVSVDTLEHVPPADRPEFIAELARVAAARLILACPADIAGSDVDGFLQAMVLALGGREPEWLREHDAYGLPASAEMEAVFERLGGWRWRSVATTNTLGCLLLTLADLLPGAARWVHPIVERHRAELERWIETAAFGPSFRKVYVLDRASKAPALVALTAPATLASALECPLCSGDMIDEHGEDRGETRRDSTPAEVGAGVGATCRSCGGRFATDSRGVLVLRREAQLPVPWPPVTFTLRPNWLQQTDWTVAIHNYIHAFHPTEACQLWLEVDRSVLSAEEALAVAQPILDAFGTRAFPPLALSDDPQEHPSDSIVVALPSSGPALVAWSPERFREAHAQAVREGAKDTPRPPAMAEGEAGTTPLTEEWRARV